MKIVVGLGNPGPRYGKTRHNVGWMVVDRLADRAGSDGKGRERDASRIVPARFKGLELTLVKPLTFMNESGLAVRKVLAREHAPLTELLVIADDFALPFGKLRIRPRGRSRAATTASARSSTSSGTSSSAASGSASASRTAPPSTTS